MRKLLLASAFALLPMAAGATTMPLTGDWSVTGLSDVSASPNPFAGTVDSNVPLNGTPSTVNLFTLSPGGTCTGSDCHSNTVTETITFSLTSLKYDGFSLAPITLTGIYSAKYSGSELSCAVGDGRSPSSGATDCLIWAGASDTYNGSIVVDETIDPGNTLVLTFHNATDWNITPTLSAQFVDAPPTVPEPASIVLVGSGLLALGLMRRRKT
jgi:hypothetical protein